MSYGPLQVAFWSLLLGFGMSLALSVTSPESIRHALKTDPASPRDGTAVQHADAGAGSPSIYSGLPSAATVAQPLTALPETPAIPQATPPESADETTFDTFAAVSPPQRRSKRQPTIDTMPAVDPQTEAAPSSPGAPLPGEPSPVAPSSATPSPVELMPIESMRGGTASSTPDIPVRTADRMQSRRRPRVEELPPPTTFVADTSMSDANTSDANAFDANAADSNLADAVPAQEVPAAAVPARAVPAAAVPAAAVPAAAVPAAAVPAAAVPAADDIATLQTQIDLLRADLERMTSARVEEQLADLRRVQALLEQMHGTEQINAVERDVAELRATFLELKSELEAVTARATAQQQDSATDRIPDLPLSVVPSATHPGQVTVEANNVPVADVLRTLARHAGRNVVCAADVGQPVTVHFDAIDPSLAIRMIVATQQLQLRDQNGLWHVDVPTRDVAAKEPQAVPRSQRLFRLRHLDPPAAARLIRPLLSDSGQISHQEERTDGQGAARRTGLEDALLVVDDVDRIAAIESLIEELDHPPQMVEIQATIFEVVTDARDQACVLTRLANDGLPPCRDPYQCAAKGGHCNCDLHRVVQSTAGGLVTEVRCRSPRQLEHALSRFGEVRTVAMPHVQVADRARAELVVGEQVLLHAAGPGKRRSPAVAPGGVFLAVRPVLSDDGLIRLEVHPRLGTGAVTTDGQPVSTGGGLETTVVMSEGCSLVIGGIVDERVATSQEPHRGWAKMPFVGRRVDRQQTRSLRRELLITITPRIVTPGQPDDQPVFEALPSPVPPSVTPSAAARPAVIAPPAADESPAADRPPAAGGMPAPVELSPPIEPPQPARRPQPVERPQPVAPPQPPEEAANSSTAPVLELTGASRGGAKRP